MRFFELSVVYRARVGASFPDAQGMTFTKCFLCYPKLGLVLSKLDLKLGREILSKLNLKLGNELLSKLDLKLGH